MKVTMAAGENRLIIDPIVMSSRAEVERFIVSLRKAADAVWPRLVKQAKPS